MVQDYIGTPTRKQYQQNLEPGRSPAYRDSPPEAESTTSASSVDMDTTPDDEQRAKAYVHARTNFTRGYVPPTSANHDHGLAGPPKIHRTKGGWEEDDGSVPFDQREDLAYDDAPHDEAADASPKRTLKKSYDDGRVGASPRKVESPRFQYLTPDNDIKTGSASFTYPATETPPSQDDSSISNTEALRKFHSQREELDYHSDEAYDRGDDDASLREQLRPNSVDDDDSLFDFEEQRNAARLASLLRAGSRARRSRDEPSDDDDSSLRNDYGPDRAGSPTNLQERTQEAWKTRAKAQKAVAPFEKSGAASEPAVSFGKGDTVNEFQVVPAYDEQTVETAGTNRSNLSTYSKSMESEYEDVVRDLFFIGSGSKTRPGRRKVKDQRAKRWLMGVRDDSTQNTQDSYTLNTLDDTVAEEGTARSNYTKDTLSTLAGEAVALESAADTDTAEESMVEAPVNDSTSVPASTPAAARGKTNAKKEKNGKEKKDKIFQGPSTEDDDPLGAVFKAFEGGFSAVGAALGLSDDIEDESSLRTSTEQTSEAKVGRLDNSQESRYSESVTIATERATISTSADTRTASSHNVSGFAESPSHLNVSEVTAGEEEAVPFDEGEERPNEKASVAKPRVVGDFVVRPKTKQAADVTENGPVLLEKDPRLEELAVHAARSKHRLKGYVFDEDGLNVVNDMKFFIVNLALPLGLLFQENEGGCWVSKVYADGNAAEHGGVEVCDQLAGINSVSAINLRVDEICTMITESPDPNQVELTFLRYTGPIRPAPQTRVIQSVSSTDSSRKKPGRSARFSKGGNADDRQFQLSANKEKKSGRRFRLFGRGKKS